MISHEVAALVTCVIHHEGHFRVRVFFVNLIQQFDNAQRVDVLSCADADEFLTVAIDGSQNIVTLPARRGLHQNSGKAPDHSKKSSHHKMGGINKEDLPLATARFFKLGEQSCAVEFKLELRVGLSGNGASLTNFHPQALHHSPCLAFAQTDPCE